MPSRILIVDPVTTNRIVLKARFAASLYTADVASSQIEAAALLKKHTYEAVCLSGDATVPALESDSTLNLIRTSKADPSRQIAVICMQEGLNDLDLDRWEQNCFASGADDCVTWSISPTVFLARVRNLMRDGSRRSDLPVPSYSPKKPTLGSSTQVVIVRIGFQEFPPTAINELNLVQNLSIALGPNHHLDERPLASVMHSTDLKDEPGILVLDVREDFIDQAISLMPQLHASAQLRATRIVLRLENGTADQISNAFNLGAAETVSNKMSLGRFANRIRRQACLHMAETSQRNHVLDQLRLAVTDPLTGLHNRRYAMDYLARLGMGSEGNGASFALLSLDIDHFKTINDTHGHSAGDEVLQAVSRCLRRNTRRGDLVARTGGEEFLVALQTDDPRWAQTMADRMRQRVSELGVRLKGRDVPVHVTLSIGLAMSDGSPRIEQILERSDKALYAAKAKGRNAVSISSMAA